MATATKTEAKTEATPDAPGIGAIGAKYRFESKPGIFHAAIKCTIDSLQDWWLDPPDEPYRRTQARVSLNAWNKRYTAEEKDLIEQALVDNGSGIISFIYERGPEVVPGSFGEGMCWKETNSEGIAWVIRQQIEQQKGDFRFVTETPRDAAARLKVGDQIFATTPIGRAMALEVSIATGQSIEPLAPTG
jgi:hypothetical protein